jgi:hypothetical protein
LKQNNKENNTYRSITENIVDVELKKYQMLKGKSREDKRMRLTKKEMQNEEKISQLNSYNVKKV